MKRTKVKASAMLTYYPVGADSKSHLTHSTRIHSCKTIQVYAWMVEHNVVSSTYRSGEGSYVLNKETKGEQKCRVEVP